MLRRQIKSEYSLIRRTKVVVPQSELEQRQTYKNSKCGNYIHSDAAKSGGWGAHCQGLTAGGPSSKSEAQLHVSKCLRNESSQIGDRVILQCKKNKISSRTNRQRHSPVPLGENGRNKERRIQKNFEGNLGVLNCERDHTYCRIPPKLSKHSDELGVTPYQGLKRVEIGSPDICKDNSDNGKTKCRPFCVTRVTHVMETGPLLHGSG